MTGLGLLLGTAAAVMAPNGIDGKRFSFPSKLDCFSLCQVSPGRQGQVGGLAQADGEVAGAGGAGEAEGAAVHSIRDAPVVCYLCCSVPLHLLLLQAPGQVKLMIVD